MQVNALRTLTYIQAHIGKLCGNLNTIFVAILNRLFKSDNQGKIVSQNIKNPC